MLRLIKRFSFDESGATAIEYALVAGLVSVSIIAGVTDISNTIKSTFLDLDNAVNTHAGSP